MVWLEPEGLDSSVIYPGGISCTMPAEMQEEMIHAISGFENAVILRYGNCSTTQIENENVTSNRFIVFVCRLRSGVRVHRSA